MYGCFFYKKKLTLPRILAAKFVVALICNVILTTLCLKFLYGQALMAILPMRTLKNLIMWPIDSAILYTLIQIMDRAGIFRIIQQSREQGKQVS